MARKKKSRYPRKWSAKRQPSWAKKHMKKANSSPVARWLNSLERKK